MAKSNSEIRGDALGQRGFELSDLVETLRYALKPQLLALYAVVYVGFALTGWNIVDPFYGLLILAPGPLVRLLYGFFGFGTSVFGHVVAAAGVVGVLKTVLEDTR